MEATKTSTQKDQYVLLVNIQNQNEPLNLDYSQIMAGDLQKIGRYVRPQIKRAKRLGYTHKCGYDGYGRMYDEFKRDGRKVKYIICTKSLAKRTLLIP